MTSAISRDDVLDVLYQLAPGRRQQIQRAMLIIDRYASGYSEKMRPNIALMGQSRQDYSHLLPGETDVERGMRRCRKCKKVRNLTAYFQREARSPYGHRLTCVICNRPQRWSGDGPVRADRYWCKSCKQRKPMSHFPERKQKQPSLQVHCLECTPGKLLISRVSLSIDITYCC